LVSWIAPHPTIIAAFVAAIVGLYWNFKSAKSARKLPFLQKQLELCFDASQAVAVLATTTEPDAWIAARSDFWRLYHGPLAIVQDSDVQICMANCGKLIGVAGPAPELPRSELADPALDLSKKIRALLVKTWKVPDLESALKDKKQEGIFAMAARVYREEFEKQMQRT
jgi:hypothetical protein